MSKVQKRRSVSLAPEVYGVAQRSADHGGLPVARWVTLAIEAYAHPDAVAELPPCPPGRCHRCGWPVGTVREMGCTPTVCSTRGQLETPLFAAPERANDDDDPETGPDGRPWRTG